MANPTHTARQNPPAGSFKQPEGFKTTIAFSLLPNAQFWEVTVQPFGLENGEAIDTTTQLNTAWRTKAPLALTEIPNIKGDCFYDPDVYILLMSTLMGHGPNGYGSVSINLPTGDSQTVWGHLKNFIPKGNKQKEAAMADFEVVADNWDPTAQVEAGLLYTTAAGT